VVPAGTGRCPRGAVFEAVVFRAGLAQVGDPRPAPAGPGQQVVRLVVQTVVAATRERAFGITQVQPVPHGFGEAVAAPADFQRRTVPGVGQDPVEGTGGVSDCLCRRAVVAG
jgi:hypothetical protein